MTGEDKKLATKIRQSHVEWCVAFDGREPWVSAFKERANVFYKKANAKQYAKAIVKQFKKLGRERTYKLYKRTVETVVNDWEEVSK